MARPDFTLIWGVDRPGGIPAGAVSAANYKMGWQFRAGVPPVTMNFDYYQNLSDLRSLWLAEQIPVAGTSPYSRALLEQVNDAAWRAVLGANNASNLNSGVLHPSLLADSGVTPGLYGDGTRVPAITVDQKGRVTSIVWTNIAFPAPPAGNESQAGLVQEANQSEVDNRSAVAKYVRPDKMGFGLSVSLGVNGFIKLPNWLTGFRIQWGVITADKSTGNPVTLGFSENCSGIIPYFRGNIARGDVSCGAIVNTPTSATIYYHRDGSGGQTFPVGYIAWGK